MNDQPQRKHPRLKHYDYSRCGMYFITICTFEKRCLLSKISNHNKYSVILTDYGEIVETELLNVQDRYKHIFIDQYVIMPNHVHAIVVIEKFETCDLMPTLSDVVCAFKSIATIKCKKIGNIDKLFQNSFYDHVVRCREEYIEIVKYIVDNPVNWLFDKNYV